jgi:hypothetical protein
MDSSPFHINKCKLEIKKKLYKKKEEQKLKDLEPSGIKLKLETI